MNRGKPHAGDEHKIASHGGVQEMPVIGAKTVMGALPEVRPGLRLKNKLRITDRPPDGRAMPFQARVEIRTVEVS